MDELTKRMAELEAKIKASAWHIILGRNLAVLATKKPATLGRYWSGKRQSIPTVKGAV